MESPFARVKLVPQNSYVPPSNKPKKPYTNPLFLKSASEYLPKNGETVDNSDATSNNSGKSDQLLSNNCDICGKVDLKHLRRHIKNMHPQQFNSKRRKIESESDNTDEGEGSDDEEHKDSTKKIHGAFDRMEITEGIFNNSSKNVNMISDIIRQIHSLEDSDIKKSTEIFFDVLFS